MTTNLSQFRIFPSIVTKCLCVIEENTIFFSGSLNNLLKYYPLIMNILELIGISRITNFVPFAFYIVLFNFNFVVKQLNACDRSYQWFLYKGLLFFSIYSRHFHPPNRLFFLTLYILKRTNDSQIIAWLKIQFKTTLDFEQMNHKWALNAINSLF